MGEDILAAPAGQIEPCPIGEEPETGCGKLAAPLQRQHRIELLLEGMEVKHVGGGIGDLGVAQRLATQSELCCCFDRSMLSSSFTRSLRPCRSV